MVCKEPYIVGYGAKYKGKKFNKYSKIHFLSGLTQNTMSLKQILVRSLFSHGKSDLHRVLQSLLLYSLTPLEHTSQNQLKSELDDR